MKKETLRKELTNKALKKMTDEGLPTDLADFLVGADEDSTGKGSMPQIAAEGMRPCACNAN